jgi:hypothetical protein
MTRPRLLDLFCGAGGAAMGYHRAGFDVTGVDNRPQPRYPFEFHQADAMTFPLDGYDVIHASPPCQAYSVATARYSRERYPDLLGKTRERLQRSGQPWVIENVPGAPMRPDLKLCGCMFRLPNLRRERWFETSPVLFDLRPPCQHRGEIVSVYGHPGKKHNGSGTVSRHTREQWQSALGIDWMSNPELALAIPPAYTEYIGAQLLEHLAASAAGAAEG